MKQLNLLQVPALWLASLAVMPLVAAEPPIALTIQADQPGARISPTMWGVFFEDINFGADGGLYAELVKNRSFEFTDSMMGWRRMDRAGAQGSATVAMANPLHAQNPHYLRVALGAAGGGFALVNEGFKGMGVKQGVRYDFSAFARTVEGGPFTVRAELVTPTGQSLGSTQIKGFDGEWKQHSASLRATATEAKAQLQVFIEGSGTLDLDMVSLFPRDTWKKRPGGLRADLVQMLADLKPGFMRFPGGCIVEGHWLTNRYQWKTTIGPITGRKLIINRWNDEFKHRPAPDYFQSFGLGFFEYFQMCEDIGAAPLPILNCGMACQFNSGELAPLDQLDPYIQDALDLIEFANGPASSRWGSQRAAMGHPRPFNMKLLGVGNEQWGPQYVERYAAFAKVLKAKHPEIKLIASAGPRPEDDKFHFLWPKLRELKADIIDEHCYARPDWFLDNAARYDRYDRTGPKVFMGEYAAQSVKTVSPENRNNLECALAEAAYMTGLERNADVVVMTSYAPLFGHEEGWQWRPNLIWCDNLRSYGTPNYYVQQLFSRNRGDVVLPTQLSGAPTAANGKPRLYASAVRDEKAGEIILKVVNSTAAPTEASIKLAGASRVAKRASCTVLTSASLTDENSLAEPKNISPVTTTLDDLDAEFRQTFKSHSMTVLRIAAKAASK